MPTSASVGYDAYAHCARCLIEEIDKELRQKVGEPTAFATVKSRSLAKGATASDTVIKPVGILGAGKYCIKSSSTESNVVQNFTGASGLYTAMILEDLGIPYRILEARRRVGGRLYTYHFPNDFGAPYNYFDVGAMRFPKIPAMNRVFNLFENANLNTPDIALNSRLTPFYFTGAGNYPPFLSYNGVTVRQNAVPSGDPFKAADVIQSADKEAYIKAGTKAITDDVIAPYATALLDDLKNNTKTGWEKMKSVDDHSTRSYMTFKYEPSADLGIQKKPLPTDVVNWCETFDKSTGWYDRAFTETVLEAIAFGWQPGPNPPATQWFCIESVSCVLRLACLF